MAPGGSTRAPIVLTEWQQAIVREHPEPLLRGLIHSDGWRGTNRVTVRGKRYAYPRYNFDDASGDIRAVIPEQNASDGRDNSAEAEAIAAARRARDRALTPEERIERLHVLCAALAELERLEAPP
jgi:hypothetical protein